MQWICTGVSCLMRLSFFSFYVSLLCVGRFIGRGHTMEIEIAHKHFVTKNSITQPNNTPIHQPVSHRVEWNWNGGEKARVRHKYGKRTLSLFALPYLFQQNSDAMLHIIRINFYLFAECASVRAIVWSMGLESRRCAHTWIRNYRRRKKQNRIQDARGIHSYRMRYAERIAVSIGRWVHRNR